MNRTASSTLMTEGSIWKKIVTFAFPLFLGNLFQQLYNTADSLIVGNFLGSDALAAVSSSGSLIFLMVGFFNGIAMGAGVVVARYYGARQTDRLQRAIHTDVAFGIVAGILLTMYQSRPQLCKSVQQSVREVYGDDLHVFERPIEYTIRIAECPMAGMSILDYEPGNPAAESYRNLASEVLRLG